MDHSGTWKAGDVMKMPKNIGTILMASWFILFGVLTQTFISISFSHSGDVLAVLAIIVGVLLLLRPQ
jgi:phosphotransferase system  glucose/maltose/N-acetylglucosamine-specific IIC component